MVQARKGVIYLAGDADAARKIDPVIKGFADLSIYFGPFGGASKVKLINNLLVSINIAAAAEAMALGLKAGVDIDAMIKAVANGSGGTTQFGIRAPWMAQRKFKPIQGSPALLSHYFGMIDDWADSIGVATPIFDRVVDLYKHCDKMGLAKDNDVAVMIDVLNDIPRERHGKGSH